MMWNFPTKSRGIMQLAPATVVNSLSIRSGSDLQNNVLTQERDTIQTDRRRRANFPSHFMVIRNGRSDGDEREFDLH